MSSLKQIFLSLDLYKYQRFFDEDGYSHSWHSYTFTFVAIFTIVYLITGEVVGHFKPGPAFESCSVLFCSVLWFCVVIYFFLFLFLFVFLFVVDLG